MDVILGNSDENLSKARDMTAHAAERGTDVVIFPELWSTGYDLENAAVHSVPIGEGIFARMSSLAREYNIHVSGSCLSLLGPEQFGNTAVLFDNNGQMMGKYTEVHLFRLMEEHRHLTPGDHLTLADTKWGKIGLAICYDLRFPELFRSYALSGAAAVLLMAEWPHPRLIHWQVLLRARAIENQMYMIACNRVGVSKDDHFFGHSCIVDPRGQVLVEAGEDEELVTAEINMEEVGRARAEIPVFADRRPAIYDGGESNATRDFRESSSQAAIQGTDPEEPHRQAGGS
jgi:predicted amidohydrolase